jgi:hypothetical protein
MGTGNDKLEGKQGNNVGCISEMGGAMREKADGIPKMGGENGGTTWVVGRVLRIGSVGGQ